MAKFLLVYHGGEGMPESEAAQAEAMAAWGGWFGQLGAAVLDGGNPAGQSKTVSSTGISDGGGANPATGYSLIDAKDLSDAVSKAQDCPVLQGGGTVEVCETIDVGM